MGNQAPPRWTFPSALLLLPPVAVVASSHSYESLDQALFRKVVVKEGVWTPTVHYALLKGQFGQHLKFFVGLFMQLGNEV